MRDDRRPTILLVEDNPDEESMVMRAIRRSPITCQLLVAHSTDEALGILHGQGEFASLHPVHPDVIVTDLRVAPLGGADLISAVRNDDRTRLIPIVVLSGAATNREIEELYRRGANSFLDKPLDFEDFATTITRTARYWATLNTTAAAARQSSARAFYPL